MPKNSTLVDIAREVGVAPSTVQRALSGAPGVSEAKRQQIREAARRMGYQRNAMATMLKSRRRELAIVLPEPDYYTCHLWDGVEQCLEENSGFRFTAHRYSYPRSPEQLAQTLEKVHARHGASLSGVLTMGEAEPRAQAIYQKWREAQVPVVFVGTDSSEADRLCCCRCDDAAAGRLAADLTRMLHTPGTPFKVLLTGDLTVTDQYYNVQAYEQVLLRSVPGCYLFKVNCPTAQPAAAHRMLKDALLSYTDLTVAYSASARNTIALCRAACETGAACKLIGSDLFEESQDYLQKEVLAAVIHKRPAQQAHLALQTLISCLVHGLRPAPDLLCTPYVVTPHSISAGWE